MHLASGELLRGWQHAALLTGRLPVARRPALYQRPPPPPLLLLLPWLTGCSDEQLASEPVSRSASYPSGPSAFPPARPPSADLAAAGSCHTCGRQTKADQLNVGDKWCQVPPLCICALLMACSDLSPFQFLHAILGLISNVLHSLRYLDSFKTFVEIVDLTTDVFDKVLICLATVFVFLSDTIIRSGCQMLSLCNLDNRQFPPKTNFACAHSDGICMSHFSAPPNQ